MLSSALALSLFCSCSFPLLLFVCDQQQLICVPNALLGTLSSHIYSTYHWLFLSSLFTPHWPGQFCLATVSPFYLVSMAKKKRTAAQFFDDAESNGLESLDKVNIDGDTVSKHLESGTEINYSRMLILWDE